jgi:hypothetical protein
MPETVRLLKKEQEPPRDLSRRRKMKGFSSPCPVLSALQTFLFLSNGKQLQGILRKMTQA